MKHLLCIILVLFFAIVSAASAEVAAVDMIIIDIDPDNWIATAVADNGYTLQFDMDDEYNIGDDVVAVMNDKRIVDIYYVNPDVHSSFYPDAMIVIEVDREEDIVYAESANGNVFSFFGTEDFIEGDIIATTLFDCGTDAVDDDQIVYARYSGSLDRFLQIVLDSIYC